MSFQHFLESEVGKKKRVPDASVFQKGLRYFEILGRTVLPIGDLPIRIHWEIMTLAVEGRNFKSCKLSGLAGSMARGQIE